MWHPSRHILVEVRSDDTLSMPNEPAKNVFCASPKHILWGWGFLECLSDFEDSSQSHLCSHMIQIFLPKSPWVLITIGSVMRSEDVPRTCCIKYGGQRQTLNPARWPVLLFFAFSDQLRNSYQIGYDGSLRILYASGLDSHYQTEPHVLAGTANPTVAKRNMTLPGENGQNLVEWRFRKEQTQGKVNVFGRKLRVSTQAFMVSTAWSLSERKCEYIPVGLPTGMAFCGFLPQNIYHRQVYCRVGSTCFYYAIYWLVYLINCSFLWTSKCWV